MIYSPDMSICLPTLPPDQFGEVSPQVANVLDRLGACYTTIGDTDRALEHLKRALVILEMLSQAEAELGTHTYRCILQHCRL